MCRYFIQKQKPYYFPLVYNLLYVHPLLGSSGPWPMYRLNPPLISPAEVISRWTFYKIILIIKIHPIKELYVCYGKIKNAQKALLRLCKLRVYWLIMSMAYYWLDDIVVYIYYHHFTKELYAIPKNEIKTGKHSKTV